VPVVSTNRITFDPPPLDHILGQLDRGLGHLQQQDPALDGYYIPEAREQYRKLKGILLEVDGGALGVLTRMSFGLINSFNPLTSPQNHTRHSFAPFLSHVRSRASILVLAPPTPCFICVGPLWRWITGGFALHILIFVSVLFCVTYVPSTTCRLPYL